MERILVEDLIQYKMIPFDLYNDRGIKLMSAGEILTSGKLLRVSQYDILYKEIPQKPKQPPKPQAQPEKEPEQKTEEKKKTPVQEEQTEKPQKTKEQEKEPEENEHDIIDETASDIVVNSTAKIKPDFQIKMKTNYANSISSLKIRESKEAVKQINEMKSKILSEIGTIIDDVKFCSQLKLLGDYYNTHSLNTSILATALGYKLEFDSEKIENLTQSALLHDIGMTKFPPELLNKTKRSNKDEKLLEKHTLIGYKILKDEMKMPEEICRVALEHHENHDGSGYPYGLSGDQIGELSRIVGLCSLFDDLTSGRTKHKVKNTKDALRVMLEFGSHRFPPELLYKFVNMFRYNDLNTFDEMVQ